MLNTNPVPVLTVTIMQKSRVLQVSIYESSNKRVPDIKYVQVITTTVISVDLESDNQPFLLLVFNFHSQPFSTLLLGQEITQPVPNSELVLS